MLGPAPIVMAPAKRMAAKPSFTTRRLVRLALWGSLATAALLVAVVSGRGDIGPQRVVAALSSLHLASLWPLHRDRAAGEVTVRIPDRSGSQPPEQEPAINELANTVRGLAQDRDRILVRLAAVEHNLDDVTGSVARQIEAAKTASKTASQPPADTEPTAATAAGSAPAAAMPIVEIAAPPALQPPAVAATLPAPPAPPPALTASAAATSVQPPVTEYAIDLGGASFIQALSAHWAEVHGAHPQLFEGLKPVVTLKETARTKHVELRLQVGPLPSAAAASRLCASLASLRPPCRPTTLDGPHLALR